MSGEFVFYVASFVTLAVLVYLMAYEACKLTVDTEPDLKLVRRDMWLAALTAALIMVAISLAVGGFAYFVTEAIDVAPRVEAPTVTDLLRRP